METKKSVYKNAPQKEYDLTEAQRDEYRKISQESRLSKLAAIQGLHKKVHKVNAPNLDPNVLMPKLKENGISALSLFSGGGGLDLGFDRAGFKHLASYELIPICGETLRLNRPDWLVFSGHENGDVTRVDWSQYKGMVDVIQGGPPCQPFSIAGQQKGCNDDRNMWGEFNRAVNTIKPRVFVAENVLGLLNPKFDGFVRKYILEELSDYSIVKIQMHAADYGVPQVRRRVFFIGFRYKKDLKRFAIPEATHSWKHLKKENNGSSAALSLFEKNKITTMGVREALGLSEIGFDDLAPTIRSGFTGKRNTTSILNSSAGQEVWGGMEVWPNGVQSTRDNASAFPAKNEHFRLSVQDCSLIQGFPECWKFAGAVYQILGQIGNSVAPPVAYALAKKVAMALSD